MEVREEVKEEITKGMSHIFTALNVSQNCAEEFCKQLEYMHNTLQQNFWRMMVEIIKEYSSAKYCDARNVASVELCRRLKCFMEENELGHLPIV